MALQSAIPHRLRSRHHGRQDQLPRLDRRLVGGPVLPPEGLHAVCTTELGYMAKIKPEFDRRGVKIIGLSVDPLDRHAGWADDIEETQGTRPTTR